MGGAPKVEAPKAPDTAKEYQQSLQAYIRNAPQLYTEEAQYQPLYNQLQQQMTLSNLGMLPQVQDIANRVQTSASQAALQNLGRVQGGVTQAMQSDPYLSQLRAQANQQLAAGPNQSLQDMLGQVQQQIPGQVQGFQDLATQAGQNVIPINQQLQALYGKVGADTSAADLAKIRDQVAANTRTADYTTTGQNVMGQLGQLDPLTAQLQQSAQSQLALGGQISAQEAQDVTQQARAAF